MPMTKCFIGFRLKQRLNEMEARLNAEEECDGLPPKVAKQCVENKMREYRKKLLTPDLDDTTFCSSDKTPD